MGLEPDRIAIPPRITARGTEESVTNHDLLGEAQATSPAGARHRVRSSRAGRSGHLFPVRINGTDVDWQPVSP